MSESGRFSGSNLSADQLTKIRYASLLHDFGRIEVRQLVRNIAHAQYQKQCGYGYPQ